MLRSGPLGFGQGYGVLRAMSKRALAFAAVVFVTATGPAQAEKITIAALGDSLTQGYGLPQEQGFVPQLQGWLDEAGLETELINAGVSGDTTAGGLARVGWTLTDDVDAMIVALGGNDFLRGIDPANSRDNLRGILEAAQDAEVDVLLVGLASGPNYGPEFKAAFDSMYPDLAAEFDAALFPDFFEGLQAAAEGGELGAFMQSDGLHPNARGVAAIVEAIGPAVADLAREAAD
jgi:acyl-CoA thioesterase-1